MSVLLLAFSPAVRAAAAGIGAAVGARAAGWRESGLSWLGGAILIVLALLKWRNIKRAPASSRSAFLFLCKSERTPIAPFHSDWLVLSD
jgi:hypothetical protein